MKKHFLYLLLSTLVLFSSCKHYYFAQYKANEITITDSLHLENAATENFIKPYRDSIAKEMNEVVAFNDHTISKHLGESELGNVLADALLKKAKDYSHLKVDFAVINIGGVRLPQLPAGNITVGTVFELMPFENMVVLLELDGKTTHELIDMMAESGGIPVAGVRFTIHNKKASNIQFNGKDFDETNKYTLAVSDYLANGGDKLDILKKIKQIPTNRLIRDAFLDYFKETKTIQGELDGRVKKD